MEDTPTIEDAAVSTLRCRVLAEAGLVLGGDDESAGQHYNAGDELDLPVNAAKFLAEAGDVEILEAAQ